MSLDAPIDEQPYIQPQVIDLGAVRVARGLSRRVYPACKHRQLRYDSADRRVWCADCETTLESFDAFMVFVDNFQAITDAARRRLDEANAAREAVIHRIAAREVEATWRGKMAVTCPHCHRGILPGDPLGAVSPDFEMARRARDGA